MFVGSNHCLYSSCGITALFILDCFSSFRFLFVTLAASVWNFYCNILPTPPLILECLGVSIISKSLIKSHRQLFRVNKFLYCCWILPGVSLARCCLVLHLTFHLARGQILRPDTWEPVLLFPVVPPCVISHLALLTLISYHLCLPSSFASSGLCHSSSLLQWVLTDLPAVVTLFLLEASLESAYLIHLGNALLVHVRENIG